MTNLSTAIQNLLRRLRGETPAKTIARKQTRIAKVATVEQNSIQTIVKGELDTVRTLALVSLQKIDALAATGALDADTNRRVIALHKALGTAQAAF